MISVIVRARRVAHRELLEDHAAHRHAGQVGGVEPVGVEHAGDVVGPVLERVVGLARGRGLETGQVLTGLRRDDVAMATPELTPERHDLLEALAAHRGFLRQTVQGLTDEQARLRSTVSELTLGGLIKHVASTEEGWAQFMAGGGLPGSDVEMDWSNPDPALIEAYQAGFGLGPDETLEGALAAYERVAAATDALVATLPDLDAAYPLPPAPWFPPGASRTVRRAIVHIVAETAQHAGHADIIREAIDGAKTMG
jgi:hypothetical protein